MNSLYPNIPTDNLYKFMTIFGLVLVIFSPYNWEVNKTEWYELGRTLEFQRELYKNDKSIEAQEKIKSNEVKFQGILDSVSTFVKLYVIGFTLGLVLLILGSFFWYRKVQRHHDTILKNKSLGLP